MQAVQDKLCFKIDTPNDEELAIRFADWQQEKAKTVKHKKRISKSAKKLARTNKQFKKAQYKRSKASV